jgi:hypothetical protein
VSDQVNINGNVMSWGSIKVKIAGDLFTGLTGLEYEDARERALFYGMGRAHAPKGKTRGKYTPSACKLTGKKATIQAMRDKLAALSPSGTSYGDVEFLITAEYVDSGEAPMLVALEQCHWTKNTSSEEENPDPLSESIEFQPLRIRRNGTVLFDESEG